MEGPGGWSSGRIDSFMGIPSSEAFVIQVSSELLWYSGCLDGDKGQHIGTILAPWL